ncbi:MAG: DegV family protein [Oscillospiraceae bacterium]|jgi:DegV family protein with EDD domain|nr:DegV family protein [Oscillospiraceae bacterium]
MSEYVIFTDSTSDLPVDLVKNLGVDVVSLKYEINGEVYDDCFGENREKLLEDFYIRIKNGERAKTSQINPAEFVDSFSRFLDNGKDILYISFTSGLSATFNSAKIAANELYEKYPDRKIKIIDSLCASMGEGLLVYEAVMQKRSGKNLEDLTDWIEKNKLNICHWVVVDDLNHLKAGGRVSPTAAFFGSILNVKPLIHVDNEGHLVITGKHRGKRKSLDFFIEKMKKNITSTERVFISHSRSFEDAQWFGDRIKAECGIKEVIISEIGCVIGAHTGVGVVAVFFWGSQR